VRTWRALGEALNILTNSWKSQTNSFACRPRDTIWMYQQQLWQTQRALVPFFETGGRDVFVIVKAK